MDAINITHDVNFSIIPHFPTVLFFHICGTFLHLISKFGKVTIKG